MGEDRDWYYPDFYAPLASDLGELPGYEISLVQGKPFQPLSQLLSVLPPQSAQLVPPAYRDLMLSPTSPVFDAYPNDFSLVEYRSFFMKSSTSIVTRAESYSDHRSARLRTANARVMAVH